MLNKNTHTNNKKASVCLRACARARGRFGNVGVAACRCVCTV